MIQFLPFPCHFFDSDFAWINLHLDLLDVIHNDLAVTHLEEYGFHLYKLEVHLDVIIHHPSVHRIAEDPQLCSLIQWVHFIIQKVSIEVKIYRVVFPILGQILLLVTDKLSDIVLGN
jgi:hypothetical protein